MNWKILAARGAIGNDKPNWIPIKEVRRNPKVKPIVKSSILSVMYGTVPTADWLWQHDWQIDRCCACGEVDDIKHCLAGCDRSVANPVEKWPEAL